MWAKVVGGAWTLPFLKIITKTRRVCVLYAICSGDPADGGEATRFY